MDETCRDLLNLMGMLNDLDLKLQEVFESESTFVQRHMQALREMIFNFTGITDAAGQFEKMTGAAPCLDHMTNIVYDEAMDPAVKTHLLKEQAAELYRG